MARVCGPILGFRGEGPEGWRIEALIVLDDAADPGALEHSALPPGAAGIAPNLIGDVAGLRFFAYPMLVAPEAEELRVDYWLVAEQQYRWQFAVPGQGQPPRLAYASCNGFSQPGEMKKIADKNALWTQLRGRHADTPFHLLLMGGDQIYADQLWDAIEELRAFNDWPRERRAAHLPSATLGEDLVRFYVTTYRDRFAQPAVADALASMPTVMMWDDHDIFDGWGSYSDAEQNSAVFRAVFEAARTAFALFQLQSDPRAPAWPSLPGAGGFDALFRLRDMGLLVLDLRSERTQRQVLSSSSWDAIFTTLDGTVGLRHLLVMSSIPLVHPDLSFVERALDVVPGTQELEDDLHDQWASYQHRLERLRLAHRLFDFADAQGTRVTILSGDVHVAALGVLENERRSARWQNADVVTQLTSSAIVHPPPPRVVAFFLEQVGGTAQEIDREITARMLTFPGTNTRIVAARNWLSLEIDDRSRIWANWYVEGRDEPLSKVVHPCIPEAALATRVPRRSLPARGRGGDRR